MENPSKLKCGYIFLIPTMTSKMGRKEIYPELINGEKCISQLLSQKCYITNHAQIGI